MPRPSACPVGGCVSVSGVTLQGQSELLGNASNIPVLLPRACTGQSVLDLEALLSPFVATVTHLWPWGAAGSSLVWIPDHSGLTYFCFVPSALGPCTPQSQTGTGRSGMEGWRLSGRKSNWYGDTGHLTRVSEEGKVRSPWRIREGFLEE